MSFLVQLTKDAVRDLEEIGDYIYRVMGDNVYVLDLLQDC